jgi:hypothetical protein
LRWGRRRASDRAAAATEGSVSDNIGGDDGAGAGAGACAATAAAAAPTSIGEPRVT